jgi:hypothetical protein
MVSRGVDSPLMGTAIDAALQRLQQPQRLAQNNLTDAFRAAGGLRGSQYGVRFNELLGNQGIERNDLISATMKQILAPLLDAQLREQVNSFLPSRSFTDLLQASRPAVGNQSSSQQSSSFGGSDSSGASMGGDDMSSWLRRIGYQPTSYGGGGWSGVNTPPGGAGGGTGQPAPYDPYGGYGFDSGGGYTTGRPAVNPQDLISYGPWEPMPSAPGYGTPTYPEYDDPGTYMNPVQPYDSPDNFY